MSLPSWIRPNAGAAVDVDVIVVPRASRSQLAGVHDGRVKVQIAAPPVDGEANAALVKFFAQLLDVRRSDVVVAAGQTGRRKTVRVSGVDPDVAVQKLAT